MNKYLFLAVISLATANNSVAKQSAPDNQCVSINMPAFNLVPDESSCTISSDPLILSKLPDQVFLYDQGYPANKTCFTIVDPFVLNPLELDGTITYMPDDGSSVQTMNIKISGVAGLTENNYPDPPITSPLSLSFTAATLVSITTADDTLLGQLVTRDAGTIFLYPSEEDRSKDIAAARMSVVKGTDIFKGVSGYIDETGKEFNYVLNDRASANGILCGKGLADDLFW